MICDLCPRRCGALRTEERGLGRCRMPELPVLARAALHRWEEPPISVSYTHLDRGGQHPPPDLNTGPGIKNDSGPLPYTQNQSKG